MIIGLTPFLYFYDNPQKPILQDGIFTRIVFIFRETRRIQNFLKGFC